jgi:cytochrome c5
MTNQEDAQGRGWEGRGMPFPLPEWAWPVTIAVAILVVIALFRASTAKHEHRSEGRFVGPATCQECHPDQFASWAGTKMANTFDVLLPGEKVEEKQMVGLDPNVDYSRDEACLPCHTTGYGLVGGFLSVEETPDMVGVTCEACHGHGGNYVRTVMDPKNPSFSTSEAREAGLVYPPSETVCLTCHNASSPFVGMGYEFDFDERVKLGTHEHHSLKYEHAK